MNDEGDAPPCDLVLEGGVTSALVYTGLVARLSRHYRLVRLGGTSSGAVAAAAAAIAQRAKTEALRKSPDRRDPSPEAAFDAIAGFPRTMAKADLQGQTALFRLFQPQARTFRSYRVVTAWIRHQHEARWRIAKAMLAACVASFLPAALVGTLLGLLLSWLVRGSLWLDDASPLLNGFGLGLCLMLSLALGLLAAVLHAVCSTLGGLRANHFGLCNGMRGVEHSDDGSALTPTLHRFYNQLLGRRTVDRPVVFGELWGKEALKGGDREIDLQVITTALNLRRPYRIPNDPGTDPLRAFFYDPKEWRELFPASVMDWLADHRQLPNGPRVIAPRRRDGPDIELHALPPPALLPVLVAVRMSLAFPGLLSAVPMYTLADSPADGVGSATGGLDTAFVANRVYFSDGAITSNCPVQLFDAPLPGCPTFAARLDDLGNTEGSKDRIWLPVDGAAVTQPMQSLRTVLSVIASIVMTSLGWRDTLQRDLPGYRERIVVIRLKKHEGGLNLAMPPRVIRRIGKLGGRAALQLLDAFGGPRTDGRINAWDRHRWLRLRSTLAAMQAYLRNLSRLTDEQQEAYRGLLSQRPALDPRLADAAAVTRAKTLLDQLCSLEPGTAVPAGADLAANGPQPAPRLQMSSPW